MPKALPQLSWCPPETALKVSVLREKPHLDALEASLMTSCSFTELILDGFMNKQIMFHVLLLISVLVFWLLLHNLQNDVSSKLS